MKIQFYFKSSIKCIYSSNNLKYIGYANFHDCPALLTTHLIFDWLVKTGEPSARDNPKRLLRSMRPVYLCVQLRLADETLSAMCGCPVLDHIGLRILALLTGILDGLPDDLPTLGLLVHVNRWLRHQLDSAALRAHVEARRCCFWLLWRTEGSGEYP